MVVVVTFAFSFETPERYTVPAATSKPPAETLTPAAAVTIPADTAMPPVDTLMPFLAVIIPTESIFVTSVYVSVRLQIHYLRMYQWFQIQLMGNSTNCYIWSS